MKIVISALILVLTGNLSFAGSVNFYAKKEVQARYPGAFATDPSTISFHKASETEANHDRSLLLQAILKEQDLLRSLTQFNKLELEEQIETLQRLFLLECEVLKIQPPELIIDDHSISGYAYFEFDYRTGGAGKVYLNKKKLSEGKDKSEFIVLLLHETRHSAQFQLSQKTNGPLAAGFETSFKTQSELKLKGEKLSFCDFMLLLNEYEAFQFANYVYGALMNWQIAINDMGTLASQFDHRGRLRLNLLEILMQNRKDPLEFFNELEQSQYEVMYE